MQNVFVSKDFHWRMQRQKINMPCRQQFATKSRKHFIYTVQYNCSNLPSSAQSKNYCPLSFWFAFTSCWKKQFILQNETTGENL